MEPTDVLMHKVSYETKELRDSMLYLNMLKARDMFKEELLKGVYTPISNEVIQVKRVFEADRYGIHVWQNVFKA